MNNDWNEYIKKYKSNYIGGIILCVIFICLSFYTFYSEPKDISILPVSSVTLKTKPAFKVLHRKSSTTYWVEIEINEDNYIYEIRDIDYMYLKYKEFKAEINESDKVMIRTRNTNIYSIEKNGKDYLDFKATLKHKELNFIYFQTLFFICLVLFAIPLNLKNHPSFSFKNKNYVIKYHFVLISIALLSVFILLLFIDSKYVTKAQFINQ